MGRKLSERPKVRHEFGRRVLRFLRLLLTTISLVDNRIIDIPISFLIILIDGMIMNLNDCSIIIRTNRYTIISHFNHFISSNNDILKYPMIMNRMIR